MTSTGRGVTGDLDRLASYLPNDFCHIVNFPIALHPLGAVRQGKPAALARLEHVFSEFKVVRFDTSGFLVERDRAAVQIPAHCQHRKTGVPLKTIRAHFWTIEAGWPVTLNEYSISAKSRTSSAPYRREMASDYYQPAMAGCAS